MAQHTSSPLCITPVHQLRDPDYIPVVDDTGRQVADFYARDWTGQMTLEEAEANARIFVAGRDMLEALAGEPGTPTTINPMSWLAEGIAELKRRGPDADCEDPDAYWEMVSEMEALHRRGSAAIAKAMAQEADSAPRPPHGLP